MVTLPIHLDYLIAILKRFDASLDNQVAIYQQKPTKCTVKRTFQYVYVRFTAKEDLHGVTLHCMEGYRPLFLHTIAFINNQSTEPFYISLPMPPCLLLEQQCENVGPEIQRVRDMVAVPYVDMMQNAAIVFNHCCTEMTPLVLLENMEMIQDILSVLLSKDAEILRIGLMCFYRCYLLASATCQLLLQKILSGVTCPELTYDTQNLVDWYVACTNLIRPPYPF